MKRMTAKECAAYLGISEFKMYEMVRQNLVPHARLGSKILIRTETIDKWIAAQEQSCKQVN